jgi:phosphate uptake regulator
MRLPKSISDNLRFLTAELSAQVANLNAWFAEPAATLAQRIVDRSDYANSLRSRILDNCQLQFANSNTTDTDAITLRAVESIATELAQINALCLECLRQKQSTDAEAPRNFKRSLNRVKWGIDLIETAVTGNDTQLALKIGDVESKLEKSYKKAMRHYIDELREASNTESIVSALFTAQSIDQMGDAMLNISESIMSANLGKRITTSQYYSLKASVNQLKIKNPEKLSIETVAETRSGSAISALVDPDQDDQAYVGIFKQGAKRKLKEERQGVERWHKIYPGLAPKILSHHKQGNSAALLIEHLAGLTFEQILLHEPESLLNEALAGLADTLQSVWVETRVTDTIQANFMQQLSQRLPAVYEIHPEFAHSETRIGNLEICSFDRLVAQAIDYEKNSEAPFSVYIHGDFNIDNIIYDPVEKRINFIDLHRSRYMDYVQDISVFMVSNYRLQILDTTTRRRIMQVSLDFYRFAHSYARKVGDDSFELRLALGLARSFATSTRFILDKSLARAMFLRARYLMERVLATNPKHIKHFRLPVEEIFID